MAMQLGSAKGTGRSRGRSALSAEINVTPFVDVMLVLLIVFMITAPLLQKGVDVSLPKAAASTLPATQSQPLSVTIQSDGKVFLQETEITREEIVTKIFAIAGEGYEERIYLRVDGTVDWEDAIDVMTRIQRGGYGNLALVTDPRAKIPGAKK